MEAQDWVEQGAPGASAWPLQPAQPPQCRPGHPPPVAPSGVLRTGWGAPDLCCCTAPLTDLGPRTVPRMPQDPGQFPLPLRLPLQVARLPGTHSLNTMTRIEKCQE